MGYIWPIANRKVLYASFTAHSTAHYSLGHWKRLFRILRVVLLARHLPFNYPQEKGKTLSATTTAVLLFVIESILKLKCPADSIDAGGQARLADASVNLRTRHTPSVAALSFFLLSHKAAQGEPVIVLLLWRAYGLTYVSLRQQQHSLHSIGNDQ